MRAASGRVESRRRVGDDGEWVVEDVYVLDGKEVSREEFLAVFPDKPVGCGNSHLSSCWPMYSEALAVHPDQIQQANERAKRHGLDVEYVKGGIAKIGSRNDRKRLLKLEGFHDNQGGYGD
jgi:hypothetical protein